MINNIRNLIQNFGKLNRSQKMNTNSKNSKKCHKTVSIIEKCGIFMCIFFQLKKMLIEINFYFFSDYSQPQYQDEQQQNYWSNQQQWPEQSIQYPPEILDQQHNIDDQNTKVEVMR